MSQILEWVTEQEKHMLQAFREFQKDAPADASFQALVLTDEEEVVLSSFRRFKLRLRDTPGIFKWCTQPLVKQTEPSILADESKPLLII